MIGGKTRVGLDMDWRYELASVFGRPECRTEIGGDLDCRTVTRDSRLCDK